METPHHSGVHTTPTNNRSHHHSGGGGSGGGREDCWSEGATAVLIDAWGDRYLQLSRGNLRQKDWKDVADAVNSRQDTVNKPRKTDVQCKNRIDTIKKKYKLERSKPGPSQWPFFTHIDELIGANVTPKPPPLPAVTFTVKKSNPNPNPRPNHNHNNHSYNRVLYSGGSSSKSRRNSPGSTGSSHGGDEDDDDDDQEDGGGLVNNGVGVGGRKKSEVGQNSADGEGLKDLAKAILSFGEIYERIESSKQEQIIELERQRMEFTKDLEFKRMQMFMEAQLELHKAKRPKYAPGSGGTITGRAADPEAGECLGFRVAFQWVYQLGYQRIIIEVDCKEATKFLNSLPHNLAWSSRNILHDVLLLSHCFHFIAVAFVNRVCNKATHMMASQAIHLGPSSWEWIPPP